MSLISSVGQNPLNIPTSETIKPNQEASPETKDPISSTNTSATTENATTVSAESKSQNMNLEANMQRMSLLAKVPQNNTQQSTSKESSINTKNTTDNKVNNNTNIIPLTNKLNEITGLSEKKNYSLEVSLPKNAQDKPLPTEQLTPSDYQHSFIRQTLEEVGISDVSSSEIKLFQEQFKLASGKEYGFNNSLADLQKNTVNGKLNVSVSQYDLAIAKTVGKEVIVTNRQARSQAADEAYRAGTKYVDDLAKGYIAARINAPINLINGITEPVRGLAALRGVEIPALPRWEAANNSEYWRKDGRIGTEELGTTLGLGFATAGAINERMLASRLGRVVVGVDASYNLGVAVAGVDPTTRDSNGNYREMGGFERGARIVGGLLGGVSLSLAPELPPLPKIDSLIPPGPNAFATAGNAPQLNGHLPIESPVSPAVPGSNISRPNNFNPGVVAPAIGGSGSSENFGGPVGRPQPMEAREFFTIASTAEGRAKQIAEFENALSPEAKKQFNQLRCVIPSDEEFLQVLSKKGDPVKFFEAKAKNFSPESVAAQDAKLVDGASRYQEAKVKLNNSEFLNKPKVKDFIAAGNENKLSGEIAVELARQELVTKYPPENGYKIEMDVELVEVVPGFGKKSDWQAANPGKPPNIVFEKDGKVWRTVTDIDLAVVKTNPKNGLSEIVHLEQIKSGKTDSAAKAKSQMDATINILQRVATGDSFVGISKRKKDFVDVTKEYDLSNLDKADKVIRGPSRKDNSFDTSVGLTSSQINKLSQEIIKDKKP